MLNLATIGVLYFEEDDNCWVVIPPKGYYREISIDYYPRYIEYTEYKRQGEVYAKRIEDWNGGILKVEGKMRGIENDS